MVEKRSLRLTDEQQRLVDENLWMAEAWCATAAPNRAQRARDHQDHDDLLQWAREVLCHCCRLWSPDRGVKLMTYYYATMKRRFPNSRDAICQPKAHDEFDFDAVAAAGLTPVPEDSSGDDEEELSSPRRRALAMLAQEDRDLLLLRHGCGLTYRDLGRWFHRDRGWAVTRVEKATAYLADLVAWLEMCDQGENV